MNGLTKQPERAPRPKVMGPADRREYLLRRFLKHPLWPALTAVLLLRGGAVLYRLFQRVLWLTTEFRPLNLPGETAFMACYEGLVLVSSLLALMTAAAVTAFVLRKSPGTARFLCRVLTLRRVCAHLAGWLCLAAAGGVCFLCVHYRLSVQIVGILGLVGAAVFVLFMFEARLFRSCRRIMVDVRVGIAHGSLARGGGVHCALALQCLVTALFRLVPVAMVLLMARLIDAAAAALPFVTAQTLRSVLGTGFTGAGAMYFTDGLQSALGGLACLLLIPLAPLYERAHD